ncbi:hypothetical protein QBC40DRAFT_17551 [Triangularia verruculosa]|uniref:DUF4048 domain-containing protein n=1 Tax=Triangularia verruculosa TaxID=2587418 RepID=A0AAN6XQW5_9PEZI|nr:hypothetical protein QBC40DRAFT_17551 [Triangularia verruculosa]
MISIPILRTCFVSACAYTLLYQRDSRLLNAHKAVVAARRTTRYTAPRLRLRRRRAAWSAFHPEFSSLRKPSQHSFIAPNPLITENKQPPQLQPPPPPSQKIEAPRPRTPVTPKNQQRPYYMEHMISPRRSLDDTMAGQGTPHNLRRHVANNRGIGSRGSSQDDTRPRTIPDDLLSSPSSPFGGFSGGRSSRSTSSASRTTNRLSLTLPIAPPSAFPSRPVPASTTAATFPPTPLDTPSSIMSPIEGIDFITAIAAQERRVMELREELNRAELELTRLKDDFTAQEAYKKRPSNRRNHEALRSLNTPADCHDEVAIRRSIELDRRKTLLGQQHHQQGQQPTPEKSRRRVFTGGHARKLSLLSPTKPGEGFSVHEDGPNSLKLEYDPHTVKSYAPVTPSYLAKRASWAPRTTPQPTSVKQVAQNLKSGIWTFMEDIRQATVGDEPITGHGVYLRDNNGHMRQTKVERMLLFDGDEQDTIRPPPNPRPRVSSAFDDLATMMDPIPVSQPEEEMKPPPLPLRRSKTDASRPTKRFSWTPLTADSVDDNDWSNWNSSPSAPSPRWSGTTVNGDIIPTDPTSPPRTTEKDSSNDEDEHEHDDTPLKNKSSKSRLNSSSSKNRGISPSPNSGKLEELLPPVLNKLTPSNIKKMGSDFMKEWERSLSPPEEVLTAGKEKGI